MSNDSLPCPILLYQNASLAVKGSRLDVGVQNLFTLNQSLLGIDYRMSNTAGVDEIELQPTYQTTPDPDPADLSFSMSYDQNGTEWDMVFCLASDNAGGTVGTYLALDVHSESYPDIDQRLSIVRCQISQAGLGFSQRSILPKDYQAQLTVKFWLNGKVVPEDGWIMLEVDYVKKSHYGQQFDLSTVKPIPIVTIGQVKLLPVLLRKE